MTIQKEIFYPIFIKCCKYADDVFWENIFENLAYGKSPYGTYISNDRLCCSYKNKEFSCKILEKDAESLYKEIYNFLTKKLGIMSQREKLKKRIAFNEAEKVIRDSRKEWNDIRKKSIKELLLELYVIKMKNKHSLNIKQTRFLFSILMMGLAFKLITTNDIHYEDGKIVKIDGIDFENKKVIFKHEIHDIEVNFSTPTQDEKESMIDNWEKYIKDIEKYSKNSLKIY